MYTYYHGLRTYRHITPTSAVARASGSPGRISCPGAPQSTEHRSGKRRGSDVQFPHSDFLAQTLSPGHTIARRIADAHSGACARAHTNDMAMQGLVEPIMSSQPPRRASSQGETPREWPEGPKVVAKGKTIFNSLIVVGCCGETFTAAASHHRRVDVVEQA